ncbi:MAG: glycosyltransferase involved in cell wall biosynthesis [Psychroserpens sp.]|jgi:glycosyltransferase involved in cell wall biosynthesis
MRKKRVLFVYHYIASYREAVFLELLDDDEISTFITSDITANNDIQLISLSSDILCKKHYHLKNKWIANKFLWQKGLLSLIIKGNFDKIIFLGDPHFITTWLSIFVNKLAGKESYIWTHGFLNRSGKLLDTIKMFMYKLSDGLLLYGNGAKQDLINAGLQSKKIHVIYNSLDYANQKTLRNSIIDSDVEKIKQNLFTNPNLLQLMFVGRLTKQKKLDMLINALGILYKRGHKINLLLIGDGSEKSNLMQLVTEHELNDYVNFYGKSYNENELAPLICSSDICVAPGEIGLTAMHSLGYGTPVITHNNRNKQMPEFEAVIQSKTGMLFEEASIESLMDTIISLQSLNLTEVRVNCIDIIEQYYTPQAQVENIKKAIGIYR